MRHAGTEKPVWHMFNILGYSDNVMDYERESLGKQKAESKEREEAAKDKGIVKYENFRRTADKF